MHILVRDKETGAKVWMPIETAARLMEMEPDEIEGALEEFGECETQHYIAIAPEWA